MSALLPHEHKKQYAKQYKGIGTCRLVALMIKEKITDFMLDKKLESGSIDVMVDKNNDYWFLEVNPVGQFDFLSGENNFYIEREIAKTLINGSKNKTY